MSCFYDMGELKVPLKERGDGKFSIKVCKTCRADFLQMVELWFNNPTPRPEIETGIFVRHLVSTIEITEKEFHERRK